MPFPTKLITDTVLLAALCTASVAYAQDDMDTSDALRAETVVTQEQVRTFMVSADIDEDGMLNVDEFKSFTVALADAGDVDARTLILSGKYKTRFTELDHDKDGLLTSTEVLTKPVDPMEMNPERDMDDE